MEVAGTAVASAAATREVGTLVVVGTEMAAGPAAVAGTAGTVLVVVGSDIVT